MNGGRFEHVSGVPEFAKKGEPGHAEEGTIEGGCHVMLRVPDIPLMSDQGHFEIGMSDLSHPDFDNFPHGAEPENGHHDEIDQHPPSDVPLPKAPEDFEKREG